MKSSKATRNLSGEKCVKNGLKKALLNLTWCVRVVSVENVVSVRKSVRFEKY